MVPNDQEQDHDIKDRPLLMEEPRSIPTHPKSAGDARTAVSLLLLCVVGLILVALVSANRGVLSSNKQLRHYAVSPLQLPRKSQDQQQHKQQPRRHHDEQQDNGRAPRTAPRQLAEGEWPDSWGEFVAVNPDASLPNRGRTNGASSVSRRDKGGACKILVFDTVAGGHSNRGVFLDGFKYTYHKLR